MSISLINNKKGISWIKEAICCRYFLSYCILRLLVFVWLILWYLMKIVYDMGKLLIGIVHTFYVMSLMFFDEVNCWNVLFFASILYIRARRRLIIFLPWRSTSSYLSYDAQQLSTICDTVGYIFILFSAQIITTKCILG